MTNEKARDFFSAYYEGTLEPGLCVSFEQKLRGDGRLNSEYRTFVEAMESLDLLKLEEIAVPADLNERIAARLDKNIYDLKRHAQPSWLTWARNLGFAGLAAAAIGGAYISLSSRGTVAEANFVPPARQNVQVVSSASDGVNFEFAPAAEKTVVVSNDAGKELERATVGNAAAPQFKSLLKNSNATAAIFEIEVQNETPLYIAVPGQSPKTIAKGEGTVIEFAKAAADFFRQPTTLKLKNPTVKLSWDFSTPSAMDEIGKVLGAGYSISLTKGDILQIEEN